MKITVEVDTDRLKPQTERDFVNLVRRMALEEMEEVPVSGPAAPVDDGNATAALSTNSPSVGQTITCTFHNNDPDGAASGISFQWFRDTSTEISGATSSSYLVQAADEGFSLRCRVNYTDGEGFAESIFTNSTALVIGSAPSSFPNALNTGVQSGITLTPSGSIEVGTNGAVIQNLDVTGSITVAANNVTVRNCRVNCGGQLYGVFTRDAVNPGETWSNLVIEHCEIHTNPDPVDRENTRCPNGIGGRGVTEVSFCNIHGMENAVSNGTAYYHDNYFHDFAIWLTPGGGGDTDHTDGVQTFGYAGTSGLRIEHNTIIGICTQGGLASDTNWIHGSSCIALSESMSDVTIKDNLLMGGSYTIYGNSQSGGTSINTVVTGNRFSFEHGTAGDNFGTHLGFNTSSSGFVWDNNRNHETDAIIPV